MRDWLSRVDKDAKEARDKRIFELWLSCCSMDEIAEATGVNKDTVSDVCRKLADLPKSDKASSEHAADFTPPIYNIWKQQEKSNTVGHLLRFEIHPDNFDPRPFRRRHKTQEIVEIETTPLGFEVEKLLIKRS